MNKKEVLNLNIRAVDVGFGSVKGVSNKTIEYPAVIGDFRPIRFSTGMEKVDRVKSLCVEYSGRKYFLGDMAYQQSIARATMGDDRFTSPEGMALMLGTLVLLADNPEEDINLITGLPVNSFSKKKEEYTRALKGRHQIKLLQPNGDWSTVYTVNIREVKVIPQPVGTIFWALLDSKGQIRNKEYSIGKLGVLDIGAHTVDLARTNDLEFIDRESTSFNDIGLFTAYQELSFELQHKLGVQITPEEMSTYINRGYIKVDGKQISIHQEKESVFQAASDKIVSRAINTWSLWDLDKVLITGGGSLVLKDYLINSFDKYSQIEFCDDGTLTNCLGYHRYGQRFWRK